MSLLMTVKNGMPFLPEALASIARQTYSEVELVVQDCMSTDGSSDLLQAFIATETKIRREPDDGIGDANNRALSRAEGKIIGTIDCDNLLSADAIARVVDHFSAYPDHAAVYGSVQMISAEGANLNIFRPAPYDFLRLLSCDFVPPWSTSFFNRQSCADALTMDRQLKTCLDFDIWLRLGEKPVVFIDEVFGSTRLSGNSMTCQPDKYADFCRDKIFALTRHLASLGHDSLRRALIRQGKVGIFCWAAESINGLAPERGDLVQHFLDLAKQLDDGSSRLFVSSQRLFPETH